MNTTQRKVLTEAVDAAKELTIKTNGDGETFADHTIAFLRDFSRDEDVEYTDAEWDESIDEVFVLSETF